MGSAERSSWCRYLALPLALVPFLLVPFLMIAPWATVLGQMSDPPATPESSSWSESVPRDPALESFVSDVLTSNPDLAVARSAAGAARARARQAGALPDPKLGGTGYLMRPQTRTGPVTGMVTLSQQLPWFGKRGLRGDAAKAEADAQAARADAMEVHLVAEARRLYYELCFVDAQASLVGEDVATLEHYEEVARARYASGRGLEQGVVKVQAEITRAQARLLDISAQRASMQARLNALRDRPADAEIAVGPVPRATQPSLDAARLRAEAQSSRPEVWEAEAGVERSQTLTRLAHKNYLPDVTIGLTYTFVGERDDPAGRASPPTGNGDDDFGITAGINLPIWRGRLAAEVEEAAEGEAKSREAERAARTGIDREVGDLLARVPLIWERVRLMDGVLTVQADQALRSAESAYEAGTANALDLLDAERVRVEARIAAERARTDYVIALSDLEASLGRRPETIPPRSSGEGR
ncbi:MAG: TolC family protein [Candidatus Eisenbacteria bacterium]|uniref:TolC family protein n=1 Tax=Eiseniibacteriota bacterium TaxID=2212470 RepID=A0A956M4U7_UNCEI|nr:TolC family protein [Candidatus Eisenbacteria bacterium]